MLVLFGIDLRAGLVLRNYLITSRNQVFYHVYGSHANYHVFERVLQSLTATRVLAYLIFVMFSSKCTIFDVALEYAIIFLLSCSWFDVFAIKSSLYITPYVMLFTDYFSALLFL